jgi:hypothetical protein
MTYYQDKDQVLWLHGIAGFLFLNSKIPDCRPGKEPGDRYIVRGARNDIKVDKFLYKLACSLWHKRGGRE